MKLDIDEKDIQIIGQSSKLLYFYYYLIMLKK